MFSERRLVVGWFGSRFRGPALECSGVVSVKKTDSGGLILCFLALNVSGKFTRINTLIVIDM